MLAVVIPAAPALVPAVGGRAEQLDATRAAVAEVLRTLVVAAPQRIVVVAATDDGPLDVDESGGASFASFGVDLSAGGPRHLLPAPHAVAAWWLDDAGWTGARRYIDPRSAPTPTQDDAVVVVADGSARRSERAPGYLDPRAEGFDADVTAALATGDAAALARLDPVLSGELMAGGLEPLRWLGRASSGVAVSAELVLADAPLGVGYWCATWRTAEVR